MKLLVSTLEPSGNLHLKALLEYMPQDTHILGIFEGIDNGVQLYSSSEFGVMGLTAVLPKILKGKKALRQMVKLAENVDKVLLIDAPAFNLPLAKAIKEKCPNKEIIYYILPKVWAWREKRKEAIEKYIDKQISIFPFEKEFYPNSLYFGNPVMNEITELKDSVSSNGITAFFAGSRKSEIRALMPLYRKLVKQIDGEKTLVISPHFEDISIYGDISDFRVVRNSGKALKEADFAYICSGTATLESAIVGTPFVLLYKMSRLEFAIAKRFVKLKYVGLPNIIFEKLGKGIFHKEFLQHFPIKELLYIRKTANSEKFLKNSKEIRGLLKGDLSRVAEEIIR